MLKPHWRQRSKADRGEYDAAADPGKWNYTPKDSVQSEMCIVKVAGEAAQLFIAKETFLKSLTVISWEKRHKF